MAHNDEKTETECKAYKPWIYENSVCETCPNNGQCEWTWEGPEEPEEDC